MTHSDEINLTRRRGGAEIQRKSNPARFLAIVLLAILLIPSRPATAEDAEPRDVHAVHAVHAVHVVLVWLKEPGNAAHRAEVIAATKAFSTLPGIEEIRVGEPVPSERPVVDDSFDIGITMVFASKSALDAYLENPEHKEAQKKVLRPLAEKVVVYDFSHESSPAAAR